MKNLARGFLWLLPAATILLLLNWLTTADVPYRLPVTLKVLLRDADVRPIPAASIDVEWLPEHPSEAVPKPMPKRIANGMTDDSGTLTLTLDIPGNIREGILERGMRWFHEDVIRRKAAVKTVLGRTVVRAEKAGWKPLSKSLGLDDRVRGLTGTAWFMTRPELSITTNLTMVVSAEGRK